ncbi:DUF1178 family protein [Cribrihabitans neustonicus]|uniref:DUF1178 family protein n=1 Tax=Cribrihabitans neustonicus TaxID=1429085 RepID=UPI003B5AC300
MIHYSLRCAEGHSFDSWFQSAAAFDKLAAAGMVACAVCGSSNVEKALMAPRVRPARSAAKGGGEAAAQPQTAKTSGQPGHQVPAVQAARGGETPGRGLLSQPSGALEKAIAELRSKVEANSDYVGKDFAAEARAMHLGEVPERPIHGEARPDEARALIEEGVPVLPLPFRPGRKSN